MKKGYIYTISFMILLSAFFSSIVGLADNYYKDKIIENEELRIKKSILQSVNVHFEDNTTINDFFENNIEYIENKGRIYYRFYDKDSLRAIIYPFSGSGLWGTIIGFLSITPDFEKIVGIDFTDHNETPGLGGRIDEDWFKAQFTGIRFGESAAVTFGEETGLDAISGATTTSLAVLRIINELLYENPLIKGLKSEAEK